MHISANQNLRHLCDKNYGIWGARSPISEIPIQFPKSQSFGFWTTSTVFSK